MPPSRLVDFLLPASLRAPKLPAPGPIIVETRQGKQEIAVVVRPAARRMILRIDRRHGGATLTLPRGVARYRAEAFVLSQLGWLEQKLAALPERVLFRDGTIIPFRGAPCRIVHSKPSRGETRIVQGEDGPLLCVNGTLEALPGRVLRFLKTQAQADLAAASLVYAGKLNVKIGRVTIKDTVSRWGSCSARGDLAFSWRLIFAPPFVLDYLAAHEVAHRLEMNHSVRYWRHVRAVYPDFRAAEEWLNRQGS
ncbi:MAG: M48 family metallopeptidase, partial [Rhabdaerophilum sp.]